jgi:CHASE2 domain-containing sensor protein/class 3 adenylate cyclase
MADSGNSHAIRSSLLIGLGVFLLVGLFWQEGWILQTPELWIYDHFVALSTPEAVAKQTDPDFVIVFQTEDDIRKLDYPLRDVTIAQLLDKIESGQPAVIGLDLYRDFPEPRENNSGPGSGSELLEQALVGEKSDPASASRKNIVAIFAIAQDQPKNPFAIPPPPALAAHPSRFGFNQLPFDDKTVRRDYMNWRFEGTDDAPGASYYSFATAVARTYLKTKGVPLAYAPNKINYMLGNTTIPMFGTDFGGYALRGLDARQAAGYQFMIDFRGPRNFKSLSVSDALKLEDPSVFRDKIVLIGADTNGSNSNDAHETPIDPLLAGVEIHAFAIRQLVRAGLKGERPLDTAGRAANWAFLGLSCFLGVPAALGFRSYQIFTLALLFGVAAIVLLGWLLFLQGYWIVIFAPALGWLLTSGLVKAYAVTHEERQRAQLMSLFSQRTSPEIAKEIWENRDILLEGGRIAARRLVVTVLFTDLKNFSTISENMSPAELLGWINEYQIAMTRHVVSNHGDINAYTGDGMMAVFGAPIARRTEEEMKADATNAVRSALSMGRDIRKMNAQWKAQGKPLAGLRVGIFTGEVMGGEIGDEGHREYTVLGDTVNTASRLESMDKEGELTGGIGDCRILIGSLTYEYVKEHFPARYVATVNLKGKNRETDVYKILEEGEPVEQTPPKRP